VYGPLAPDGTPSPLPLVSASAKDPAGWVEPVPNQQLAFRTTGQCETVSLVPFYKIADQKYVVYWKVRGSSA
ncbi:MAG TPA: DUF4986 domain-containing protein, partial [Terriglobales bacterium]|nr:DUF4986 domain-containing protein [Terriglobales bacterium]